MTFSMLPFSKSFSVPAESEEINIQLNDTEGNPVECNYARVSIQGDNAGADAYFYIRPEGVYAVEGLDPSGASNVKTDPGAGVAGSSSDQGAAELLLPGGKTFTSIAVGHNLLTTVNFIVTYGSALPMNPRDTMKSRARGK